MTGDQTCAGLGNFWSGYNQLEHAPPTPRHHVTIRPSNISWVSTMQRLWDRQCEGARRVNDRRRPHHSIGRGELRRHPCLTTHLLRPWPIGRSGTGWRLARSTSPRQTGLRGYWSSGPWRRPDRLFLLNFPLYFLFVIFSLVGGKKIGEPHYDGWILWLHGWMLDGDEIWIYL